MTRSDAQTWVGTSWKMTKSLAQARDFIRRLASEQIPDGVQVFVLPSHTTLAAVRDALPTESKILVGAQDAHWESDGAHTGSVSMAMVADAGARLVEVGHSERRAGFGETDEIVARKVQAAFRAGLTPLLCVGESARVRAVGQAPEFVHAQLARAVEGVDPEQLSRLVIAYEPLWAIGASGDAATVDQVEPVMTAVARFVEQRSGGRRARALLYGGSVSPGNAADLLTDLHTDGLFVGRAAWDVDGLLNLIEIAARRPPEIHRRS